MEEEKSFDIDSRIAELEREFGSGDENTQPSSQPQQEEYDWSKKPEESAQTEPQQEDVWSRKPEEPQPSESAVETIQHETEQTQQQSEFSQPEQPETKTETPVEREQQSEYKEPETSTEESQSEDPRTQSVSHETELPEKPEPTHNEQSDNNEWSPETALKELEKENKITENKVKKQKERKSNSTNDDSKFKKFTNYVTSNSFFDVIMLVGLAGVTLLFISQFAYLFLGYSYKSINALALLGTIITLLCAIYFIAMVFLKKKESPATINQTSEYSQSSEQQLSRQEVKEYLKEQQQLQDEIQRLEKELRDTQQNQETKNQSEFKKEIQRLEKELQDAQQNKDSKEDQSGLKQEVQRLTKELLESQNNQKPNQSDQPELQKENQRLQKELQELRQKQQKHDQAADEKLEKERLKFETEETRLEERKQKIKLQLSKAKSDRECKNLEQEIHDIDHALKTLRNKYALILGINSEEAKKDFSHSRYVEERKKFEEELGILKTRRQELLTERKQATRQVENTEKMLNLAKNKRDVIIEKEKLLKQQGASGPETEKEKARLETKHNEQSEIIKDLQSKKLKEQELQIVAKEKYTVFEKEVLETRTRIFALITEIKDESKECFDILKQLKQTLATSLPLMKNPNPKVKPVSQTVYDIIAKKSKTSSTTTSPSPSSTTKPKPKKAN